MFSSRTVRAKIFEIDARRRKSGSTRLASCADFVLRESAHPPSDELYSAIATQTNISPYCIDHQNRCLIFAETSSPEADASAAPFYYQHQFETAIRLIAVPYELAHQLAERAPQVEDVVLIHSVGRCGSTLVSRIWQRLEDTYSLSEPDVFTDISQLCEANLLDDEEALRLLGTATRLLCKPQRSCKRFVLKFRARCIDMAELMYRLFPAAKLLFVYRNAIDCVDSHVRVFAHERVEEEELRQMLPGNAGDGTQVEHMGRLIMPLVSWCLGMRYYVALREYGLPFAALRYEDLVREPQRCVAQFLQHCAAPELPLERMREIMSTDSQAGTRLTRNFGGERTLAEAELNALRSFLERYTDMTPDTVLPGTFRA